MSIMVLLPILLFITAANSQATNNTNTTVTPVERCGRNQNWSICPDPCAPKPTCDNLNVTQPPGGICQGLCRPNCTCVKGYVWFRGECIRRTACPNYDPDLNPCGIGGFEDNCARACQFVQSCDPKQLRTPGPVKICIPRCIKECRCYPGYVLFEGRCITWSDCNRKVRPTHFHSTTTVGTTETT